ncbi:hypothetical protein [Alkalicoccus saliphilus]|jgi:uncharacterized membrane protein YozB (DUF420 family)|uniref:Membrane protein NfeD2 N-terminal transmembrane domain-containing protein n=1 Tax=Alkalicoccus saliphilus TaxID=200989 RepID=A0A2T4U7K2_9BACI|nr:hypothetical protein [Alkalicoccus saliphilus]PTL39393.1 hypothetical protein C6Y45_06070 [Alkalicoccus saliphilus]
MELFGLPMSVVYLVLLFTGVSLAFLYIVMGEWMEGLLNFAGDALNAVSLIGYITLLGGLGYVGEVLGIAPSAVILIASIILAAVIMALINYNVVIPLKRKRRKERRGW